MKPASWTISLVLCVPPGAWKGDPLLIRDAYTAALALQYALRYGRVVADNIGDEKALSGGAQILGFKSSRDLLAHMSIEIAFLLDLADEAFCLQKELNL